MMINVTINGMTKQFESGTPIKEIVEAFGDEAAQFTCAARIDERMHDLDHKVTRDCEIVLLTFRDIKEQRERADAAEAKAESSDNEQAALEEDEDTSDDVEESEELEELDISDVFSQDAIDAIQNEIKNMMSGGFDEEDMTFEPRRALELLDSVAQEDFDQAEKEAVYEAVTEAVVDPSGAFAEEETVSPAVEESDAAPAEEEISEAPVDAEQPQENDAETSEAAEQPQDSDESVDVAETAAELYEISDERLDAIVEKSAAEAALHADRLEDLCDEVMSGLDTPVAQEILEEAPAEAVSVQEAVQPEKPVNEAVSVVRPPQKVSKKDKRTASNVVKAAAVIAAVGALGWFGGKAAIQAIGSRDARVPLISRSDYVSRTDAVSKSDVSASDLGPVYNAALLTFGSANELVQKVQTRLVELRYLVQDDVNGTYDKATEEAVAAFRADHQIDRTGYIDLDTFNLLFSEKVMPRAVSASDMATEAAATTMSTASTAPSTTTTESTATRRTTTTERTTSTTRRTTTTEKTTTTTRRTTTTTKRTTTKRTTTTTEPTTTTTTSRTRRTTTTTRRTTTTTKRTTTRRTTTHTTTTTTEPIPEPTTEPITEPTVPSTTEAPAPTSAPTEPTTAASKTTTEAPAPTTADGGTEATAAETD